MRPAFENSQPVCSVDFQYPEQGPLREESAIKQETIIRHTQFLAEATDDPFIQTLAYLMGVSPCKTQKELAEKQGVSEARISQRLKLAREKIAQLSRQNAPKECSGLSLNRK